MRKACFKIDHYSSDQKAKSCFPAHVSGRQSRSHGRRRISGSASIWDFNFNFLDFFLLGLKSSSELVILCCVPPPRRPSAKHSFLKSVSSFVRTNSDPPMWLTTDSTCIQHRCTLYISRLRMMTNSVVRLKKQARVISVLLCRLVP